MVDRTRSNGSPLHNAKYIEYFENHEEFTVENSKRVADTYFKQVLSVVRFFLIL